MRRIGTQVIERWLYARGFRVPEVRKLACVQIYIMLGSFPAVVLGSVGIDFLAGVVLSTVNFLALAKVIQELVFLQRGAIGLNLFSFYGRMIVTALAFYLLIVFKEASVVALLLGFSTVLINILLWGMTHFLGKTSKEA